MVLPYFDVHSFEIIFKIREPYFYSLEELRHISFILDYLSNTHLDYKILYPDKIDDYIKSLV